MKWLIVALIGWGVYGHIGWGVYGHRVSGNPMQQQEGSGTPSRKSLRVLDCGALI